jgi:hypothetical protein
MDAVFKKMNYKNHQNVLVINAPASFDENLDSILETSTIHRGIKSGDKIEFVVGFAITQKEVDNFFNQIAPQLDGDAVIWISYPKGSSKKYQCEFNRDTGWAVVGQYGLEPVRQVAIDDDWSALRFRKVEYIKTLKRNAEHLLSDQAKARKIT